ncbi:hypothetical protein [Maribacter aestuarii]|uniref:hypothetical protein n=1 Tax=Maribacter aestuarii TaxID=1130723 RepID=UPI00248BAAD0|nr:hypothetical protein [Maribacter aestuarii]
MKKRILLTIMSSILICSLLESCRDSATKNANVDATDENIQQAADNLAKIARQSQEDIEIEMKAEWEKFRSESEVAIDNTGTEIQVLRDKIAIVGKKESEGLNKELDTLEQRNKRLKERLAERSRRFKENLVEFNEAAKEKQGKFQREFQHDMKELGSALKNFFKDNVD